jgi:hypothetical protein
MMFERLEFAAADAARGNADANFVRLQRDGCDIANFQLIKRRVAKRTHGDALCVPFLAGRGKGEDNEKHARFS